MSFPIFDLYFEKWYKLSHINGFHHTICIIITGCGGKHVLCYDKLGVCFRGMWAFPWRSVGVGDLNIH